MAGKRRIATISGLALALAAGLSGPVFAQAAAEPMTTAPATPPEAQPMTPSESAVVNLIRLLVKQGTITQASADALMAQAQAEAAQAKAAAQSTQMAATAPALPPAAPGSTRVMYVPQVVKDELREQVRQEVLAEVKDQRWALPEALPAWISRVEWSGDLRVRNQSEIYDSGNTNEYVDFARLNATGPVDINASTNPNGLPFLNTLRNREENLKLRARLGLKAKVTDQVLVGIRLASGSNNGPVSTNDSFGGGFSKKSLWLDQAYVTLAPASWGSATLGRMPNPFTYTDLVYDDDLNFDGAALKLSYMSDGAEDAGLGLHATLGAFPLEYRDSNAPANSTFKNDSLTKWLLGAQVGGLWKHDNLELRADLAHYDFRDVRGQLSDPCALVNGNKDCSTDSSRPAFMQKGNTLFLIRDIIPDPVNPNNYPMPQYAGLAYKYQLVDLILGADLKFDGDRRLSFQGEYVKNLGFHNSDVCRYAGVGSFGLPVNNIAANAVGGVDPCPATAGANAAHMISGDIGWMVRGAFGQMNPRLRGQWNVTAGYKHLESDAVVDAYTDSDFHLGGTNAQGYYLSGAYALYDNTRLTLRWLSANEISGPPLQNDVGQIDLTVGF